jgi:hypothetical protein
MWRIFGLAIALSLQIILAAFDCAVSIVATLAGSLMLG